MKKNKPISSFLTLFFIFNSNALFSQAGSLDSSFGTNGRIITDINSGVDSAFSVAIQSNGKIVVAGTSFNTGSANDFSVVRYNTNGSLDTTFGGDGKVTTALGTLDDFGRSVAIQSDGKIVVVGTNRVSISTTATRLLFGIVRYNSDGSLDTTFDVDGIVTVDIGDGNDNANSVAIQDDGKIVVSGSSINGSTTTYTTIRLNRNGSLDTSFSTDGKIMTLVSSNSNLGRVCAIQSDGKIVVGGSANSGLNANFGVVRYNTDGTLDTTFSSDGKALIPMIAVNNDNMGMVIQPDGKIVLGGNTSTPGANPTFDFAVARFNSDGSADTTFDLDGKQSTPIGAAGDVGNCVALQADGKIIVGGYSFNGVNEDFALIRYNTNGSLDTNFDLDGKVTAAFGGIEDVAYSVAVQADGKIILVGKNSGDFAIMRFNASNNLSNNIDYEVLDRVKLYPNPSNNLLTIEVTQDTSINLFDSLGKIIFSKNLSPSNNQVDVQTLGNGLYFIKSGDKVIGKFLKN
jgi:uncharacterized delta-60 repeat protein